MRRLLAAPTLARGVPLGLAAAVTCFPYIWHATPASTLRTMQLWYLPVVTVILALVTVAWGKQERPWREQARLALRLAVPLGVVLAAVCAVCQDRLLRQYLPERYPNNVWAVLLALPWVGCFQTLVAVTGPYAFAVRLSRRQTVGLVAVILAHQGLLLLQLREYLPLEVLALAIVLTGLHGLVLGWSYISVGFTGPVVVAMVCHLRHLVRILLT